MNKFYLTYSNEAPKHPSEVYDINFETGISWYGQINPSNISLDDWKNNQLEKHDRLVKELQDKGRIRKLNLLLHPTKESIKQIESRVDFIKWL